MADRCETLLVVDDEPMNILVLRGILGKAGYRVLSAPGGAEALELAQAERPDLVLLDVMMPELSGFEACRLLRQSPATGHIPVIFVTCLAEDSHKIEGLDTGAVDYITKPFNGPEVVARVRAHLEFKRRQGAVIDQQAARLGQIQAAQQAMLVRPEDVPEARFAVHFLPVLEAGGDFYDVVDFGGGSAGYFLADVSGHDLGASFITSSVKALFRQHAGVARSTRETLEAMNRILYAITPEETYLTAVYLRVDRAQGRYELCGAGHPPVFASLAGAAAQLRQDGTPLGLFPELDVEVLAGPADPGDRFFLHTDGLAEGVGTGYVTDMGFRAAFAAALERSASQPLDDAVRGMAREFACGCAPLDDVLLMGVEV